MPPETTTTAVTPCQCDGPGQCPVFGRKMTHGNHQICSGANCTPERTAEFQQRWRKLTPPKPEKPAPPPLTGRRFIPEGEPILSIGQKPPKPPETITYGITAFRRPDSLRRLVASIRERDAESPIMIVDNGDMPVDFSHVRNLEYITLPFDVGISVSRNTLAERMQTDCLFLLEDDFVFRDDTDTAAMLDVLRANPEVGCAGGDLWVEGQRLEWARDLEVFRGHLLGYPARGPFARTPNGTPYQLTDCIFNFGLWRREMLADQRWDARFKLREHVEYFWSVKAAGKWRVAYTPTVSADHVREHPGDYREFRKRALTEFDKPVRRKHNWQGIRVTPMREVRRGQNIVVLGIGHSGTSVLTHMLAKLGWSWGHADGDQPTNVAAETRCGADFAEHLPIRQYNDRLLQGDKFDVATARTLLSELPQPWAIKDPRFVHTLPTWSPAFAPFEPLLLWITRDVEAVKQSYRKRTGGELSRGRTIEQLMAECQNHFDAWPFAKLRIAYEDLQAAVQQFKVQ